MVNKPIKWTLILTESNIIITTNNTGEIIKYNKQL